MKDDELIEKLRNCANGIGSLKSDKGDYGICDDAADAIEALTTEVERKDAALQAYLDAFDKGTGTVYVEPIIRAALQPQEKVG